MLMALCGMLIASLLHCKKFRSDIEAQGYEVNPCNICVANKTVNGLQHTTVWHVDDLKASHEDSNVNNEFAEWLEATYGDDEIGHVTVHRSLKHDCLAMVMDCLERGKVKIDMRDYVSNMIEEFPQDLTNKVSSPAAEKLYSVDQGRKLNPMKAEAFHTFVAKALFLTKRARPDIQPAVSFLCTRVKEPTTYDWHKLVRLMQFLKDTKEDCLTLESDGSGTVTWGADAAFAVHPDMKSHSGQGCHLLCLQEAEIKHSQLH